MPLLRDGDALLTQSLAIIEYLDETHPEPPLLPADALGRARVRALALDVACEIHPLNNLRVLRYLVHDLKVERGRQEPLVPALGRNRARGGRAPARAASATGRFCHGDTPTLADCALVPQIFNAQRFDCRIDHVPTVMRVFDACMRARRVRARRSPTRPAAAPTRDG